MCKNIKTELKTFKETTVLKENEAFKMWENLFKYKLIKIEMVLYQKLMVGSYLNVQYLVHGSNYV